MKPPTRITAALAVAGQPDAETVADWAKAGYRTIINNRPDGEEPVQLPSDAARREAERLGLAYIHIPVTAGSIDLAAVAAFDRAVVEGQKPVVAHCRSGTRSYLMWAAAEALYRDADPQALVAEAAGRGYDLKSLPELVARLRRARGS